MKFGTSPCDIYRVQSYLALRSVVVEWKRNETPANLNLGSMIPVSNIIFGEKNAGNWYRSVKRNTSAKPEPAAE